MSIEIPNNNPTKLQALYMASFAGIELTSGQITQYIQYRRGNFFHITPEEQSLELNLSDQRLLDKLLTPEQRPIFRLHYPNIFQPDTKSED